jgi:hypothetical protein
MPIPLFEVFAARKVGNNALGNGIYATCYDNEDGTVTRVSSYPRSFGVPPINEFLSWYNGLGNKDNLVDIIDMWYESADVGCHSVMIRMEKLQPIDRDRVSILDDKNVFNHDKESLNLYESKIVSDGEAGLRQLGVSSLSDLHLNNIMETSDGRFKLTDFWHRNPSIPKSIKSLS